MENSADDVQMLASNEEWALLRPLAPPSASDEAEIKPNTYFLLWLAEEDMPEDLLAACQQISKDPPNWPGVRMGFQNTPSPGLTLEFSRGWEPVNTTQEEDLFGKILWEIQRAGGK